MRASILPTFLMLVYGGQVISALVTLQTMRNLTVLTRECKEEIVGSGEVDGGLVDEMARVLSGVGGEQVLLRGGDEDGGEVEDTVAAALRLLCSDLLVELEKPLTSLPQEPVSSKKCQTVIKEYHEFLAVTVKFLHAVQERQMRWRWSADSTVFDGVSWMQGLWASRSANSQHRSFIEQQMSLYAATGCFGKSKEVLRRDMEVVEYLNDLLDSFD